MDAQDAIQGRLKKHGVTIYFYGTSTIESRWAQIRAAIIGSHLSGSAFGKRADGTFETYSEIYERATGTPLIEGKAA